MKPMSQIIKNEWINLVRNRTALWLLGILVVLSGFTIGQAAGRFREMLEHRSEVVELMRSRFTGQGEVIPHSAAHYGHFVYKPLTFLSVLDEGVNPFSGVSLYLEGHRQNEALFSPSQQSSSSVRFGLLRLNLILQMLLPLFILFVCHNAISREREEQTLRMNLAQGITLRGLAWAKILAYSLVWWALLAVILGVVWLITPTENASVTSARVVGLFLAYGLYYFVITAVAVYLSARSKSSGNALLTLLALWVLTTVILPKATANIGENSHPLISRLELEERISEDNKNGLDGHDPRNERTVRFRDSLMTHYGVDTVSKLPVDLDGLTMQADEEYHNRVYDTHFEGIRQTVRKQNSVTAWSSWINPFAALRNLSMSLAGTDVYHHFDFVNRAEDYRRVIIKKMNDEQAYGGSKTGEWDWTVKADFWEKIADFNYVPLTFGQALKNNLPEAGGLLFWLLLVCVLVQFTVNKIKTAG